MPTIGSPASGTIVLGGRGKGRSSAPGGAAATAAASLTGLHYKARRGERSRPRKKGLARSVSCIVSRNPARGGRDGTQHRRRSTELHRTDDRGRDRLPRLDRRL